MVKVFLFLVVFFMTAVPCWAAVVRLVDEGSGLYQIVGEGLEGVASVDFVIRYDARSLQILKVSQGPLLQGMLFAGNPNQLGQVRVGAVGTQVVNGSGILATLSGKVISAPTTIFDFSVNLSDATGKLLPVRSQYPQPAPTEDLIPPNSPLIPDPTANSSSSSISQMGTVITGATEGSSPWLTTDTETQTPPSVEEPVPYVAPLPESESRAQGISNKTTSEPYVEKKRVRYPSVLERFKKYKGPRTLKKMKLLFSRNVDAPQQQPEILLANGEAALEVEFPANGGKESSIALRNARLLWSGSVGDGRFLVRCIPQKDALLAKIIYLGGEKMVEIPLTVAPAVSIPEFRHQVDKSLPALDLDGDGENTRRDDYILVANLLTQMHSLRKKELKNKQDFPIVSK